MCRGVSAIGLSHVLGINLACDPLQLQRLLRCEQRYFGAVEVVDLRQHSSKRDDRSQFCVPLRPDLPQLLQIAVSRALQ